MCHQGRVYACILTFWQLDHVGKKPVSCMQQYVLGPWWFPSPTKGRGGQQHTRKPADFWWGQKAELKRTVDHLWKKTQALSILCSMASVSYKFAATTLPKRRNEFEGRIQFPSTISCVKGPGKTCLLIVNLIFAGLGCKSMLRNSAIKSSDVGKFSQVATGLHPSRIKLKSDFNPSRIKLKSDHRL